MTNSIDIKAKAPFPVGALSNFAPQEGLLQAFKVADPAEQVRLCGLVGSEAQSAGRRHDWQRTGTLWWKGVATDRLSDAYQNLLDRAYEALFEQSSKFRNALAATGNAQLMHSMGSADPTETILTSEEFCSRLERLRARLPE